MTVTNLIFPCHTQSGFNHVEANRCRIIWILKAPTASIHGLANAPSKVAESFPHPAFATHQRAPDFKPEFVELCQRPHSVFIMPVCSDFTKVCASLKLKGTLVIPEIRGARHVDVTPKGTTQVPDTL
jgi:hypothetical protein